jgi:hypothetical protein
MNTIKTKDKTKEQLKTILETSNHIEIVRQLLRICTNQLTERGVVHDATKNQDPELSVFTEYTPKLEGSTYGSEEYEEFRAEMRPALEHHYRTCRHHPEHFRNGVEDMNLLDLLEMVCDWKASSLRHHDGNILKSIEINTKRFGISKQLARIMKNTVELFE